MTDRATPDAASDTTDLFEIIRTTRSMRRLKPDPVPNELIRKILEAGVCAPSGGNMQRWQFLVIRDPKVKETVGAFVQACVGPFLPAVGAYRRRRPNRWVLLTYEWRRRWISEWTVDGFASGLGLLLAHKLAEDSTSRLPHGTGRVNPPLA